MRRRRRRTTLAVPAAVDATGANGPHTTTVRGGTAMTAPAPPREGLCSCTTLLDLFIAAAVSDLRSARAAAARTGNRANLDRLLRAEEHLDALLEYRHAALHGTAPVATGGPAWRGGPARLR